MNFLDTILGRNNNNSQSSREAFGRYSDSQKSDQKYTHWDKALQAYEEEKHLLNFTHLLEFLKDDELRNLTYSEEKGVISFEFYQGSKLIRGTADRTKLRAEAKIAKMDNLELGFARHLIEQNFELQYCRFALCDTDHICIIFDTYAVDASPYKLYYAFKELAARADKQDDKLLAEYSSLSKVDDQHISPVPQAIKDIKYDFIKTRIEYIISEIDSGKINVQKYPTGLCYLILDLAFKIDYLVAPEGQTMDLVEEINSTYLLSKGTDIHIKNQKMVMLLKGWLARSKSSFDDEIYNTISTFGITMPSGHDKLSECIDSELSNMDWYYENQYDNVALAIPSYLIGYLLYSYALPEPDKDFLHLLYEILERDFIADMGYPNKYIKKDKLQSSAIKRQINNLAKNHQERYPELDPDASKLDFTNLCTFSKSYLLMLKGLDMYKAELRVGDEE